MNTIYIFNLWLERENGNILIDTKCFFDVAEAGTYYQKLRNQYNLEYTLKEETGRDIFNFILK